MTESSEPLPRRRICVIYNPAAGRGSRLFGETLDHLSKLGVSCDIKETRRAGDGTLLARRAIAEGSYDAVAAAGGDGTINEVANGLTGSDMPMAVLPVGTANALAYELDLEFVPEFIARTLAWGSSRTVYPGSVNGRHFLLVVGVGLDARSVAGLSLALKRVAGKAAYALAAVQQFLKYSPPALKVTVDGQTFEAEWVLVFKASHYAGNWAAEPGSKLDQPGYSVVLLPGKTRRDLVPNLLNYALKKPLGASNRCIRQARNIRIEGESREPVQMDGDAFGCLPVAIESTGATLQLIQPPKKGEGKG